MKKGSIIDRQVLIARMKTYSTGDVISFCYGGKWFIQYVDSLSTEISKKPSVWCNRIARLPYMFPMEDENKTWVRGVHESIHKR